MGDGKKSYRLFHATLSAVWGRGGIPPSSWNGGWGGVGGIPSIPCYTLCWVIFDESRLQVTM